MTDQRLLTLARRLAAVERNVSALGSNAQLAYSAIEDGALSAYAGDSQVMTIGRQWDGTYNATAQNGPTPPTPLAAVVDDATEALIVRWNGLFASGGILPMDFLRVDAHIGATAGFTPDHSNRVASFVAATGGEQIVGLAPGTYYVKLVTWTVAGVVSPSSVATEADSWPVIVSSDGFAPASSPDPFAMSGIDNAVLRWTAITNADPVKYEIHVSDTLGFTADSTTYLGETEGTQFTVKRLPGPEPAPGDADPYALQYDTTYYARIIAKDDDGAAAQSLQAVVAIFRVEGVQILANTIVAEHVQLGTLTGELFSAEVILASVFKTATEGQRVEFGTVGIKGYKSDGSLMINFPTDGTEALFDGELVVRRATVLGGMSIQSATNEMTADAAMILQNGIASPSASPQFEIDYDKIQFSTASLTPAQKTGVLPGGPFDFAPGDATWLEFKPTEGSGGTWIVFQARPNGSRAWFFDINGAPKDRYGTGVYFNDYVDWQIWSTISIPTGPKAGVYNLFRFVGGSSDWYISCPVGTTGANFQRYTPLNPAGTPALGTNGTELFVAEVVGTQLKINYHNITAYASGGAIPFLPAPYASYSSVNNSYGTSLCAIQYDTKGGTGGFDRIGGGATHRYATAERGVAYAARLVYRAVDNILYPGSSGGWTANDRNVESWESPTSNRRGMAWDSNNQCFWTLGGDGFLYKHTSEVWDPGFNTPTGLSTWWGGITFRSSSAGYETTLGAKKSFQMRRRAKLRYISPDIPYSGGSTPSHTRLYMGRGATQPADTAMYYQGQVEYDDVPRAFTLTTLATTTAAPVTNTFPAATPAMFRNVNSTMRIDADGLMRGVTFEQSLPTGVNRFWGPIWKVKPSNQTVTNNTTITPDTALFWNVEANATYLVEMMLIFRLTANNTAAIDAKVGFSGPSGFSWTGFGPGPTLAITDAAAEAPTTWRGVIGSAASTLTFGVGGQVTATLIPTFIPFQAIVKTSATFGTVTLNWAQNTANATGLILNADSYLRATRIS
jgi:hypothetical protein